MEWYDYEMEWYDYEMEEDDYEVEEDDDEMEEDDDETEEDDDEAEEDNYKADEGDFFYGTYGYYRPEDVVIPEYAPELFGALKEGNYKQIFALLKQYPKLLTVVELKVDGEDYGHDFFHKVVYSAFREKVLDYILKNIFVDINKELGLFDLLCNGVPQENLLLLLKHGLDLSKMDEVLENVIPEGEETDDPYYLEILTTLRQWKPK